MLKKRWVKVSGSIFVVVLVIASILTALYYNVSVGTGKGIVSISVYTAYAHPAAPILESDWTVNDTGGATATSITLTKPAGVSNDDLLLLLVGNDESNVADWNTLSGWNMSVDYNATASDAAIAVYWRIATGDASETDPTPTCSLNELYGWYIRVSGVDTTTPIHLTGTPAADTTEPYTIDEITTTVDDCLVFYLLAFDGGDGEPFNESGTGWVEVDEQNSGEAGTDASGCWGTKTMSGQGLTGDVSVNGDGNTDGTSSVQFAVAPPSVAPDISVSPIFYDFGVVAESTTPYTATNYFTIDNTSTMQTDQTIAVTTSTWSGGVGWTHSDTATPGANQAGLLSNKEGTWGVGDVIVKFDTPDYIAENQPASTDYGFGLKLIAPTSFGDGVEKAITVRITAVAG